MLIFYSCNKETDEIREYYTSGSLRYEAPLKNGKKHGKAVEYFENGKLKGYAYWKDGLLDGRSLLYFENGNIDQEKFFKDGLKCCASKFYREDGSLTEIQYYNNKGRMIDYKKILRNGRQSMDEQTRMAILLSESDTVNLGDYFKCEIRLGNKRYNNIEVIIGERNDPNLLRKPKLEKIDSVTAVLKVKADTVGSRVIKGVIFEFNRAKPDSILTVPFEKSYYVKAPIPMNS